MRPVIGITTYVERARWGPWETDAALVPAVYVRVVECAGGRAVLVPPAMEVDEVLDVVDGLLFTGGADVDPARYGADPHGSVSALRPDRDRAELALLRGALDRDLPVLCVCRGMQLLNVARGGTLEQHLPQRTGIDAHMESPGVFALHEVNIEAAEGVMASVLGSRRVVRSHHHQAPDLLGEGLQCVARAPDGTVEGLEMPGRTFVVGVLWHPEEDEDCALFEALIDAARVDPAAAGPSCGLN
nr:gamma-glutamyl-gamma-aminobutyrate hydrolase family protein [Actinomycetota bacterium]